MSANESKNNPSQAQTQSHKPGNSLQPKVQHSSDTRKPLPFDDNGTTGPEVLETTNPKIEGFES